MLSSLAPVLVSLGAPILGSILRTNVGGIAGEASAQVIDALAQAFGAQPTPEAVKAAIEADPKAATKVQSIERERSAEWVAYLTMATSQRNRMLDREDGRGGVFSWGWRPAMSWMLLFLWSWNGVILPIVNATAGASIGAEPVGAPARVRRSLARDLWRRPHDQVGAGGELILLAVVGIELAIS